MLPYDDFVVCKDDDFIFKVIFVDFLFQKVPQGAPTS